MMMMFRFNDASTHEGHLRPNGVLTWFCNETAIMINHICMKCKTRMKKVKVVSCTHHATGPPLHPHQKQSIEE